MMKIMFMTATGFKHQGHHIKKILCMYFILIDNWIIFALHMEFTFSTKSCYRAQVLSFIKSPFAG